MYLLRRKSDGKFWKNSSTGHNWRTGWHEAQWVTNPSECRPFKTKAAAMCSRGVGWPGSGFWRQGESRASWRKRYAEWRNERVEAVPVTVKISI